MTSKAKHVYIIGAGASGLMAACRAAQLGARVTVYEAQSAEGKKLAAAGNGKCNYTNTQMSPSAYHIKDSNDTPDKMQLYRCFERFGNEDAIAFFRSIGIEPFVKNGYVYPRSEQGSSVVHALARRCEKLGVRIIKDHRVESIRELGLPGLCSHGSLNKNQLSDAQDTSVILACGSKAVNKSCNSYRLLEELGVSYSWIAPALCPIYCKNDDEFFKVVTGVRCRARVGGETGELQFNDYGLSGIVIFNISHEISGQISQSRVHSTDPTTCKNAAHTQNGSAIVRVDFVPEYADEAEVEAYLAGRARVLEMGDGATLNMDRLKILGDGFINSKLWEGLVDRTARKAQKSGTKLTLRMIAHELKNCEFTAYKTAGFDKCQVCSGGIGVDELDPETMQLRKHPGIYAAGEILDMDGICGGYNLQWAWTSGYIAGTYAAGYSL